METAAARGRQLTRGDFFRKKKKEMKRNTVKRRSVKFPHVINGVEEFHITVEGSGSCNGQEEIEEERKELCKGSSSLSRVGDL